MTISSIGGGFLPSSLGGAPLGSLTTLALAVISAANIPLAAAASTAGSLMETAKQCKTTCETLKDGAAVCWAGCVAVGTAAKACWDTCSPFGWLDMVPVLGQARNICTGACLIAKPFTG